MIFTVDGGSGHVNMTSCVELRGDETFLTFQVGIPEMEISGKENSLVTKTHGQGKQHA